VADLCGSRIKCRYRATVVAPGRGRAADCDGVAAADETGLQPAVKPRLDPRSSLRLSGVYYQVLLRRVRTRCEVSCSNWEPRDLQVNASRARHLGDRIRSRVRIK